MGPTVKFSRRDFIYFGAGAATLATMSNIASAEIYPARPIRLIVGFVPGGPTDIMARLIAQWLSERLSQSVIVENRPGAASNIGAEVLVRAAPDGYTLFMANISNAVNATLYGKLPFDFVRDVVAVAGIVRVPYVMEVNPDVPARTVAEFIAYAKSNAGKVSFASAGTGTGMHMSAELFKLMTGVDMLHVPYRGSAPALTDLMAGRTQVMFDSIPSSIGYVKAGKLRALAVTTLVRLAALPDVPTVADTVPGYEVSGWFGLVAPRGTPPEIVEKLNRETNAVLADPTTEARLGQLGGTVMSLSPAAFGTLIADETEKWAKVVKFAGISAN
jgi:tripartite-type tricarboxylate transporter receptor subunit TctC